MDEKIANEFLNCLTDECKLCSEMKINLNTNNETIYNCQECKRLYLIKAISLNQSSHVPSTIPSAEIVQEDEFVYRSWNIKKSDVISLQTIYSTNQLNSSTIIPSISIIEQRRYFQFNSKCFHLGGYSSPSQSTLKFVHNQEIDLKAKDDDFLINMQISLPDIEYCAALFHEPVYMLCLKLSEPSAKIFIDSLKILPSFKRKYVYSEDDIISNTMVINIDMKKEEVAQMSRKLNKFFRYIPKNSEFPSRLNFLNLSKSKKLIIELFNKYLTIN